jgi:hypothetical protein
VNTKVLLEGSLFVQSGMCCAVLATMLYRRAFRVFPQLGIYLSVQALSVVVSIALMFFRKQTHLDQVHAYNLLFGTYWISSILEFILRVLIVYSVFAEAMRPFAGLHRAGKIVFIWAATVSGLVALALLAGPQVLSSADAIEEMLGRLQQGLSVLTLCLLVLVCFTTRPLGLTFRSHIFGVSLGLGFAAMVELVQAAWAVTSSGHSVYSPIYLFASIGFCVALAIWGTYFALPEPKRRMILLPTTSPFFFWNRISEILGDAPGQVAVAGFTPDMLAPAEIEMLTAATSTESVPPPESRPAQVAGSSPQRLPQFAGGGQPSLAL